MNRPSAPVTYTIEAEDRLVAGYLFLAVGLSIAEAAVPLPLPGVKPGLANIIVLLVLLRHGWRLAAWVALLRIPLAALLFGQFFTPGFFLSLAGGLAATLTLGLANHLPRRWFGPVTLSVLASFAHISGQLLLAHWWLVPHGIGNLLPLFAASAWIFGTVNGLVCVVLWNNDQGQRQVDPTPT